MTLSPDPALASLEVCRRKSAPATSSSSTAAAWPCSGAGAGPGWAGGACSQSAQSSRAKPAGAGINCNNETVGGKPSMRHECPHSLLCTCCAAKWRGAQPLPSAALTPAPAASRASMAVSRPKLAATASAVRPWRSGASTLKVGGGQAGHQEFVWVIGALRANSSTTGSQHPWAQARQHWLVQRHRAAAAVEDSAVPTQAASGQPHLAPLLMRVFSFVTSPWAAATCTALEEEVLPPPLPPSPPGRGLGSRGLISRGLRSRAELLCWVVLLPPAWPPSTGRGLASECPPALPLLLAPTECRWCEEGWWRR